jgi:hypothetical protein
MGDAIGWGFDEYGELPHAIWRWIPQGHRYMIVELASMVPIIAADYITKKERSRWRQKLHNLLALAPYGAWRGTFGSGAYDDGLVAFS